MKTHWIVCGLALLTVTGCSTSADDSATDTSGAKTASAEQGAATDAPATTPATDDVASGAAGAGDGLSQGDAKDQPALVVLCMAPIEAGAGVQGLPDPPAPSLGCMPSHDGVGAWTCAPRIVSHDGQHIGPDVGAHFDAAPDVKAPRVGKIGDLGVAPPLACFVAPPLDKAHDGGKAPIAPSIGSGSGSGSVPTVPSVPSVIGDHGKDLGAFLALRCEVDAGLPAGAPSGMPAGVPSSAPSGAPSGAPASAPSDAIGAGAALPPPSILKCVAMERPAQKP